MSNLYKQQVKGPSLSGLKGILLVLGAVAAAILGSAFFTRLSLTIGRSASIAFIAYCCLIAWFLLSYYVMGFVYTCTDDCLRVCRTYGKRERFMCDVWLNTVQAYGAPEEVKQRFPEARVEKAVKERCDIPHFAIAYKTGGKTVILHIQPDDTLKEKLVKVFRAQ